VVDDAIVMIGKYFPLYRRRRIASAGRAKGSEQIGFTISRSPSLSSPWLIPLLFHGRYCGRLFREFAVTLAVTIIVSALFHHITQ